MRTGLPHAKCPKCDEPYYKSEDLVHERRQCVACLVAEIARLIKILAKYGNHDESCPAWNLVIAECDCGFRDAVTPPETEADNASDKPPLPSA